MSDIFRAKSDKAISNVKHAQKIVNDILICAPNYKLLYKHVEQVLENCRSIKITISPNKLEVGNKINFAGYTISPTCITQEKEKIESLRYFPPPHDRHEMRSFLRLDNQLEDFVKSLTTTEDPLHQLFKKVTHTTGQRTYRRLLTKLYKS